MENEQSFENRMDLSELRDSVEKVKAEIAKIIVGQHHVVDLLLTAILSDGHVLIEGVPGVAKTLTSKLLAKTIDAHYSRIQFTPDLMPSDVLGTSVFNMKTSDFEFKAGPIFSNIVLIDEINRAPAKTQAALFEVMEERQVTIDGIRHAMDEPYLVLATQNPIEQEGTYRLPEAQLDRFLFKVVVNYPEYDEEVEILKGHAARKAANDLSTIQAILKKEQIAKYRKQVLDVHVEDNLMEYIAKIVQNTRKDAGLYLGASPRASVALLHSAKAYAAIQGRDFVTPEDVKSLCAPVMRHRVMLNPEKEMEGQTSDEVIKQIVEQVEVPR